MGNAAFTQRWLTGSTLGNPRVADGDPGLLQLLRQGLLPSARAIMLRALADEDALRVFAAVVAATGTGLPQALTRHDQLPLRHRLWVSLS